MKSKKKDKPNNFISKKLLPGLRPVLSQLKRLTLMIAITEQKRETDR
jgi:hypothetical protein